MAHPPATELVPGIWRIPTVGRAQVNSYAFVDGDGSVTLVDCGLRSAPPRIVAGLAAMGKHPSDVARIVLTHAHPDHAGGAAELARQSGAPVAVHVDDVPYAVQGRAPRPDQSLRAGRFLARLPGGGFPPVPVGEDLTDEQVLDVGGGLRVVATPGHSPGHVSLLHEPTRLLVTGDAIFNVLRLAISPRPLCSDFRMTRRTAHRLGELDYDAVAFTHGPEITEGGREVLRAFLARTVTARTPE
ncbi:MBL fold metallo-hydrolase [Pseudonocardia asaccharolytica]|uniref:Putative metallo-beta-lactamase superfamily protein n=1 Tax=Pseudonocardia asaccharolytica DSM 44247 = NBRC 16224 TaxID=1123024 RepID=A0A511CZT3_9PSEU|nr:MBL fold metallo-hydrolase [Pseudonocardia asaccharolytica]GEL18060.1 putative metallo-beta-lactamase superfamily protein [Pseudonocardia asaccharolytica DSM 44247 = NBRC 16224]